VSRSRRIGLCAAIAVGALACEPEGAARPPATPNLLVVVLDDVGLDFWPDHPVRDAPPRTPRLDRIAARGVTFEQAWASPFCAASRAQAITGRASAGTRVFGPTPTLRSEECTLPEALAAHAPRYARAVVGKWHVSADSPLEHGLDRYVGSSPWDAPRPWTSGFVDYYRWQRNDHPGARVHKYDCNPQLVPGADGGCWEPAVAIADALGWIREQEAAARPWFLWLGLNPIHFPYYAPPDGMHGEELCADRPTCAGLQPYPSTDPFRSRVFSKAMLEATDAQLGRLLGEGGIDPARNAWVVVVGDNGTDAGAQSASTPFRGRKEQMYEGGIRVPILIAGPGIPADRRGTRSSELVHVRDVFATVLDAAGVAPGASGAAGDCADLAEVRARPHFDSVSLLDVIEGQGRRAILYTDGPGAGAAAVRDRRYKLMTTGTPPRPEAYDLVADPGERTNRIDDPSLAEPIGRLRARLEHEVGIRPRPRRPSRSSCPPPWRGTGRGRPTRRSRGGCRRTGPPRSRRWPG
jgi:arylsulfatase A-like enzyme